MTSTHRLEELADDLEKRRSYLNEALKVVEAIRVQVGRIGVQWKEGLIFHYGEEVKADNGRDMIKRKYFLIAWRNKDRRMDLRVRVEAWVNGKKDHHGIIGLSELDLPTRSLTLDIIDEWVEEYIKIVEEKQKSILNMGDENP